MAMAGNDLLERAWLALAETAPPTPTPQHQYRPDEELPPCVLCGWPETVAFKGSVVCVRCRSQILGVVAPREPAPSAHDDLGRFLTVLAPNVMQGE